VTSRPAGEALDLLAYFHYAVGAMAAMLALVPALYLFVYWTLADPTIEPGLRAEAVAALRLASLATATIALVGGLGLGLVLAWAGRCLRERRRWAFCRGAALAGCLFVPFGTILGAVTLASLTRPDVRATFS
jgi:hypothetical protein